MLLHTLNMASESKFDTPASTPEGKSGPPHREAVVGSHPAAAARAGTSPLLGGTGAAEAKEADVADGEIMVNDDPRAVAIVKGFSMCVVHCTSA